MGFALKIINDPETRKLAEIARGINTPERSHIVARNHWDFGEDNPIVEEFVGSNGILREKIITRATELYAAAVQAMEELDRAATAPGLQVDPKALALAKGRIIDDVDGQIATLSKGLRRARKVVDQRLETLNRRPDPIASLGVADLDRASALRPHVEAQVKGTPPGQLRQVVEAAVAVNDKAAVALLASLIGPEVEKPQRQGENADTRRQLNDLITLMDPLLPKLAPEAAALIEHAEIERQDIEAALREMSEKTHQRARYEQQLLIQGKAYLHVETEEQKAARISVMNQRPGFDNR